MNPRYSLQLGVLFLLCEWSLAQSILNAFGIGQICTHCVNAHSWKDCHQEQCQNRNEDCYIRVTEERSGKMINAGCINETSLQCKNVLVDTNTHTGFLIGKRATTLCEACCQTNNCNVDHCKHINFAHSSNHAGVDHCRKCHLKILTWVCDEFEQCSKGQVCFLQQLEGTMLNRGVYYHGGCIDESRCGVVNVERLSTDLGLGVLKQGECCFQSACNNVTWFNTHQQGTALPQQTRKHCMKCVLDNANWNCNHQVTCGQDEVCFVQELQLNFLDHKTYYHGGCIKQAECNKVAHKSVIDEHGLADVVHGECCNTDDCNRKIMQNYMAVITTQPTTITTTGVPTTCEVCHGSGCDSGSVRMSQCPQHSPLCMTTVVNHQHSNKVYTKSCASEAECDQKWLKETIGKAECIGFQPNTTYTFNFICNYCCVVDGCNKITLPQSNTLYLGKQ